MKNQMKQFGQAAKMIGWELPKAIVKKTFTKANQTDAFPSMKRRKK
jgi:hypothetical protein